MKTAIALLLALGMSASAWADCAPQKMVKVVVRQVVPAVAPAKTFYRLGSKYGRVEEAVDPRGRVRALLIVDEPNVWVINLATHTGRHLVDPGPTFVFRTPIFETPEHSPALRALELGCEVSYMEEHKATRTGPVRIGKGSYYRYTLPVDKYKVVLLTHAGSDQPAKITLEQGGKPVAAFDYQSYETGLAPNPALFAPPKGITFTEEKVGK